jgi:hypothetical protein
MTVEQADTAPYVICSGTDGDLQLIARDPDARWVVTEQLGAGTPRELKQNSAEGELAYYGKVLDHPCWYVARDSRRVLRILIDGDPEPLIV